MKSIELSDDTKQRLLRAWEWLVDRNLSEKAKLLRACIFFVVWLLIGWNNNRSFSRGLESETGFSYAFLVVAIYMNWFTTMIFTAVHGSNIVGYFWDKRVKPQ
jgi:hypothetical protein